VSSVAKPNPDSSGTVFDLAPNGEAALFPGIHDAYGQLGHGPLRQVLFDSLAAERESVPAIARSSGGFLVWTQARGMRRRVFAFCFRLMGAAMAQVSEAFS
jgi:hypothetical protein